MISAQIALHSVQLPLLTSKPHSRLLNEGFLQFVFKCRSLSSKHFFVMRGVLMVSFVSWQDDSSAESDDEEEGVS